MTRSLVFALALLAGTTASAIGPLSPPKRTKNSVHKTTHTKVGFRLRNSTIHGDVYVYQHVIADKRHYVFKRSFTNRGGSGRVPRFRFPR
jgi:hypothetical protein